MKRTHQTIRIHKQLLLLFICCMLLANGFLAWYLISNKTNPQEVSPPVTQIKENTPLALIQEVQAQSSSSASFDVAKFQSYGFPAPEDPNPAAMSEEVVQTWNQYLRNHVAKASDATGVDPGIIGMWPYVETQGSWTPFDNCDQEDNVSNGDGDPNTQCHLWGDYWQVGPGNHLAYTHGFLADAFDAMYGSQDNATVQKVGQSVIDNHPERFGSPLTIVSSFPNVSLSSIIQGAVGGDLSSRNLMATLMKDDAIGVYLIARHFRDNIGIDSGLAAQMEGWSSSYYGRQKIVNHIKAVYDAGVSGGGGGVAGASGSETLTLTLRPVEPNSWVINYVTANAIGGGGTSQGLTSGSLGPVNPDATCPGEGGITCSTLSGGCHCSASYQDGACGGFCDYCQPPSNSAAYAIDISNPLDAPVYVPKISIDGELRTVTCLGYDNFTGSREPGQIIQILSCSDDKTDEPIWMQFHHSKKEFPLTIGATYKSGDAIGKSADFVSFNSSPHVHFQIGVGGPCGSDTSGCRNADQYVKCE